MDAQIVKDVVLSITDTKIEKLKEQGVIVADYNEVLRYLQRLGYSEHEVQEAIRQLVREHSIKAGKFGDGRGWLRDYRQIDRQEHDLQSGQHPR